MSTATQPLSAQPNASGVCVIIAAYNAEATIGRTAASALAEPEVTEVVVVDDASSDGTMNATRSADDGSGRLKVLVQPQNAGPSAARNRAISESSAPWIAILDADDFFLPGRIKGLLSFAGNADFIADDLWQVPEHDINGPRRSLLGEEKPSPSGRGLGERLPFRMPLTGFLKFACGLLMKFTSPEGRGSQFFPLKKKGMLINFSEFVLSNVTGKRQRAELGFIKPLMRRQFLDTHNIRYREHMRLGEDFELYARSLAQGARLLLVPAQGYVSVMRKSSLSGRHTETDLLHLRDCDDALIQDLKLSPADKAALRQHYLSVDCRLQWRSLILAVKKGDTRAALATFLRPWPVPFYLSKQLARQFFLRVFLGRRE